MPGPTGNIAGSRRVPPGVTSEAPGPHDAIERSGGITVYWRRGCMFCSSLLRQLDRHGVAHQRVDIWADPEAAALVRSMARGHETVPTVVVGGEPLVNPRFEQVMSVASVMAPGAVPDDYEPPQPGRFGRWLRDRLGGTS